MRNKDFWENLNGGKRPRLKRTRKSSSGSKVGSFFKSIGSWVKDVVDLKEVILHIVALTSALLLVIGIGSLISNLTGPKWTRTVNGVKY